MYNTIKLTNEIELNSRQKTIISDIAHDIALIKDKVPFHEDVVVQAGFVVDMLFSVEPHDIDAYYTTKVIFDCIKNRVHEIRFDGWLCYPYFIHKFPHVDYCCYYANNCLRGFRTIFIKNYTGIGPNYKMLLANAKLVLDYVATVPEYRENLNKYHKKRCIT